MSITNLSSNCWLVRVRMRKDGKVLSRKETVNGSRQDALQTEARISKELTEDKKTCSLKIGTFSEALTYYRENTEADLEKINCLFDRLDRDLGTIKISGLLVRFSDYWRLLRDERAFWSGEKLKNSSRNKILGYANIALNFCVKRGMIDRNPLALFDRLPEEARDRVLDENETERIIDVMRNYGLIYPSSPFKESYLLPAFLFSLKNPIRRGDLENLTRENLDWFKPWIHFYASKTRKVKPRETCLPFLDDEVLTHFKNLPEQCPFLFPRIDEKGECHSLGDFKQHWQKILDAAMVEDFHWHDLKHCAITWILDNDHSDRDLKNLGIQYSPAMIDRYYKHDANKVLTKWKSKGIKEVVAPKCGPVAEKTA